VEKAEENAEIVKAAVVVVAATIETTNANKKGPDPEDECPAHGGHLWRKCNQNP
jgi:hypothetical protein